MVADLMISDIGDCHYPMVCGNYGICSSNGQCSCLEEAIGNSTFRKINYTQPSLGCSLVTPISCDHSRYHTLLELKNTSYFYFNSYSSTLEDSKKSCLENCSYIAALFIDNWAYDPHNGCFLLLEVFSLINNEGRDENVTGFLNVQKSLNAEYHIPSPTNSPQKKSGQVRIILGSSFGAFFGVFFVVASCIFLFKKKREFDDFDEFFVDQVPRMPTRFSYKELRAVTNNFNHKLGKGGFGSVFHGTLSDGTNIVVRGLNGFDQLLVCEYMSNGSLDKWIFQRHQELTLRLQSRRNIIMDIAKGLAYLHEDCGQKIFYLDIKSQNILLGEYCNAKISDFGLSKLIDKDQSQVVTTLRGTPAEVVEMMRVAVWCLQSDFSKRPSMLVVVKVLEGSVDVESNLDYNFTNPVILRSIAAAGQQQHATGATTTLLFPLALSGSR
ncbi:unnamed protein product [Camellia sinensis]